MDLKEFEEKVAYLSDGTLPRDVQTKSATQKFLKQIEKFTLVKGQLYKVTKGGLENLVIPKYRMEPLLYLYHDDPTGGHLGVDMIMGKLRQKYYWPNMIKDVKDYVESCYQCQRRGKPQTHNEMHAIVAKAPFERVGIDFVGPLPQTSQGNKYILVAVDYFTKWPEVRATKKADAATVIKFLYEEIICRHGPPVHLHSDRGTHFVNALVEGLSEKFRMRHHRSTPYHPQANGQVERFNRTLCEALAKQTEGKPDWDEYIQPTLFAYRTASLRSTGVTPFFLVYGRDANWPPEVDLPKVTLQDHVDNLIHKVPQRRSEAHETVKQEKDRMIERYTPKKPLMFQIGDKVWYHKAAKEKSWSGKLEPQWGEPMIIERVLRNGTYIIGNEDGTWRTPVNGDRLKIRRDRLHMEPQLVIEAPQI